MENPFHTANFYITGGLPEPDSGGGLLSIAPTWERAKEQMAHYRSLGYRGVEILTNAEFWKVQK